ncbi:phosphoglycerate mutase [Streptomyces sp. S8]|uniref:histidine phosphatase family protein n=1 Tax=Streptomyces sp. S8 TaxID=1837283 RepID=UPI000A093342|nr:histidine phosphatase family protein [Streptomyces sp. S8]ARI50962.1 phosphoglycerate mutase [Streptomyces sp. S8]
MTVRVTLVSPALNAALREAHFDGDAPLDRAGERAARAAASAVPRAGLVLNGLSLRCRETAAALGLAARPEPALTGWDLGRWSGRRLDEVGAAEPAAVAAWVGDPSAAPHGGESLRELVERVGGWLDGACGEGRAEHGTGDPGGDGADGRGGAGDQGEGRSGDRDRACDRAGSEDGRADDGGTTAAGRPKAGRRTAGVLAVVEPAVVRAAVVHGLALPLEAFWRLDVAPLALTELSGRPGRWNVRLGRPLTASQRL